MNSQSSLLGTGQSPKIYMILLMAFTMFQIMLIGFTVLLRTQANLPIEIDPAIFIQSLDSDSTYRILTLVAILLTIGFMALRNSMVGLSRAPGHSRFIIALAVAESVGVIGFVAAMLQNHEVSVQLPFAIVGIGLIGSLFAISKQMDS